MRTPRDARLTIAAALVLATVTGAAAALTPTAELRQSVDQVISVVQDPQLKGESHTAERREAIRRVASGIFDFQETARRALGRHWQERTPQEREEFVKLFSDLLEQSYARQIEQYQGERIVYAGESVDGDHATVKTKITTAKGTEIPVDYRMLREGDHWRVYDVLIEGVSLVGNYRTQFTKIIETQSYRDLVQKLRAKAFEAPGVGKKT
jgi:phospholipid transport system substrate-binding protein